MGAGALAAFLTVLATVFQSPKAFLYDASTYWFSAVDLTSGVDPYDDGLLHLRGAWTTALYAPAAAATRVIGAQSSGFAVLVENALIIALIGVVLVPGLVGIWRSVTPATIHASAAVTWLLLVRFAPYPLTDIGTIAILLTAVLLLTFKRQSAVAASGFLMGIAFNIRPAYLLSAVVIAVAVLAYRRRRGIWFVVGAAAALVPQVIVNLAHEGGWAPWPPDTTELTTLQSSYAAFVVRYDTVAYTPVAHPQLFFCDPGIARDLGSGALPDSPSALLAFYARHPIDAAVLMGEKIAASLHWPVSAPYYAPAGVGNPLFALLVTIVAVGGAVLLWSTLRTRPTLPMIATGTLWVGTLATLATSTPETRFALPLVIIGTVGCVATLVGDRLGPGSARTRTAAAVAVLAVVAVFSVGQIGLAHPAPEGYATSQICARS